MRRISDDSVQSLGSVGQKVLEPRSKRIDYRKMQL